jgi:hypothetical protein
MVEAGAAPIDRYVVTEHLSEGGMGAIYVGKKLGAGGFEMEVVLKQLLPEFTQQEEFIDLFLREAKLSATLDHANIVHTIDLVTAGNEYFIVMEYLPGGDLRTLLKRAKRRGKRFSPAAGIYICREVLSALAYAHAKRDFEGQPLRLIHRDVSPSNVLVSQGGEVKLTDFGIAKAATHTSLFYKVKGKVGYMSPEQAKSESLDHRSDLYSLAVCMYEVLTAERLFVHVGLTTSADEIYSQPVPQVSRKAPGLPQDMDAIMARALAIAPDNRYQTAGELQEALARCAHRHGLLMSAPELAAELIDACGPFEQWRDEEGDDDEAAARPRAGTEVYAGDDDDDDDEPSEEAAPIPLQNLAAARGSGKLGPAPQSPLAAAALGRAKTEIGKLQGVELTSIINMMDIEGAPQGSRPLVDIAAQPMTMREPATASPPAPSPRTGTAARPAAPPAMLMTIDARGGVPSALEAGPAQATRLPSRREATELVGRPDSNPMPRRRGLLRPWLVVLLVLIAAAAAGVLVALSGPDVGVKQTKPTSK